MTFADIIGFAGVVVMLVAFGLSNFKMISANGFPYLFMNLTGALAACTGAILIHYIPFIIMEGAWAAIAAVGLLRIGIQKPS